MDFREQLKTYKPKASGLEIGIMKTKDEGKIGMFQEAIQEQKDSKMIKDSRIKMYEKYKL